jgi:N-acetylneuraminic acid mutarotase
LNNLTGATFDKPKQRDVYVLVCEDGVRTAHVDVAKASVAWVGGDANNDGTGMSKCVCVCYGRRCVVVNTLHVKTGDDPTKVALAAAEAKLSGETCGARTEHSTAVSNDTVYVFGGRGPPQHGERALLGDLWSASVDSDGNVAWQLLSGGAEAADADGDDDGGEKKEGGDALSWQQVGGSGTKPFPRCDASLVLFEKALYLYGGCTANAAPLDDLWKFDLASKQWSAVATDAAPIARHSAALTTFASYLVLHGGATTQRSALNDAWAFDTNAGRWWPLDVNWLMRSAHYVVARPTDGDNIGVFVALSYTVHQHTILL